MNTTIGFRALAITLIAGGAVALAGCADAGDQAADTAPAEVASSFSQELHDALPERILEKGSIAVVGDVNPPWRIPGENGGTTGLQTDLLAEFAEILGVEFEQVSAKDVSSVKLGVQSGRYDIAFGPLLSSETTRQDLIMIDHSLGKSSFLFAADGPTIESYADLCGKTVSFPDGTAVFDMVFERVEAVCAEAGAQKVERLPLTDNEAVILAVKSGKADAAGMSVHQAAYAAEMNGGEFDFYVSSEEESPADQLSMGLAVEQQELAEAVFGAWETIFDNGAYEALMSKYGLESIALSAPVLHLDGVKG